MCLGRSLRGVSVKSRFRILTLLVQRGAGTVGLTRPARRTVFRRSESEGRTPGAMATPLRIDLRGTNRLTCQRDTVSPAFLEFVSHSGLTKISSLSKQFTFAFLHHVSADFGFFFYKQSSEQQCRARCTSFTHRQASALGTTLGYHGMVIAPI